MKLLFERSVEGRRCTLLPKSDVPPAELPQEWRRTSSLPLPQLSEIDLSRHYTELAKQVYGVNDGFYPLGSCTMKYNPALNEEAALQPGFTDIHPLQPEKSVQGCLKVLYTAEQILCEVTGMEQFTFQPAAGAHGELTGLLLIKAYLQSHGGAGRTKILIPDSAHGTNPASAAMSGFKVVNVPSAPDGSVDLDALRQAAGEDTAGLMLTNPNTLGLFDPHILEITQIVHRAGGLCYYDGANLNAIMGNARPGDMGFDVVHLNLHKTFSTPHGGGGPGSGAVGVKDVLVPYLPGKRAVKSADGTFTLAAAPQSIGSVKAFWGNFLVVVRALCYMLMLGGDGMREASRNAVLNANYLRVKLQPFCKAVTDGFCMHEFVLSLADLKRKTGVTAMDLAKAMLDHGMHAPTMYFPLIVPEALMFEPTETESKESLDEAAEVLTELFKQAYEDPEALKKAPVKTPIGRPDEVEAARHPILIYPFHND